MAPFTNYINLFFLIIFLIVILYHIVTGLLKKHLEVVCDFWPHLQPKLMPAHSLFPKKVL